MLKLRILTTLTFAGILAISCSNHQKDMKEYIIEITSFQFKETVSPDTFWMEDAKIETSYTSQQPGFISRESGYSERNNEVVVVVRWKTPADADASMEKFMSDTSVQDYAAMIEGTSMKMFRYKVR